MPRSDLPRPTAPPWRPAKEISPLTANCKNCWSFEMPAHPLTPAGTNLAGFTDEEKVILGEYLRDVGFCTLHPPTTGPNHVGLQPMTHASYRCAAFTHAALMRARIAKMAKGEEPDV